MRYDGEEMAEEMHRARMRRTMRLPSRGDSMVKLATRICVEASEEEMEQMMQGEVISPEEVIAWARAEMSSPSSVGRAKWRAFWSLQPPLP